MSAGQDMKSGGLPIASNRSEALGLLKAVGFVLALLVFWAASRILLFQPFNIPSRSLVPSLLTGDYLFVSKYAYGYSHYALPAWLDLAPDAMPGRLFAAQPKRGDIVVFKLPSDGKTDYIKRLIGLPGDRIQLRHGRLLINGAMVDRTPLPAYTTIGHFGSPVAVPHYEETLPGGVKHEIIQMDGDEGYWDNTAVYEVPPGHYFMMGDNRDNSSDSRLSSDEGGVGYVPFDNLVGRAGMIFFSLDSEASDWTGLVRWRRLFQAVR